MPYVQSGSVGDFIPEPRCSKSIVGLQMREREREMGCSVGLVGRAKIDRSYAMNEVSKHVLKGLRAIDLMNLNLKRSTWVRCLCFEGAHPLL